jgi:Tfp pilus assembly protein PilF
VVTFLAQSQPNADAVVSLGQISLPYRFANALISYDRYLLKIFWPTDLSIIYPLLENSVWMQVAVIASITTLVIVSWLVWRLRQQFPYLFVGWLWFLGTLLPVIGLVQVGIQAMADRYTYIPSVGIFIAIAFGIRNLISRFQIGFTSSAIAGGLILTSCLTLTERQLSYWRNSETLFKHAIAVTKNNYTAHLNVAIAIAGQRRRDEALVEYHEALFIEPELQLAHDDLAALLSEMGRPHEALIQLQQAVNLDPRDRLGRLNYGILEAKVGHLSEAINQFTQSAQLDPKNPKPFFEMGRALLQQGRDDEAISNFRKALRLDPNNFEMLIYLSRVLASDQKEKIRSGSIALAMAAEANDLTHETQPIAFDAMAMAYAEIGQFSEAQKAEEYAIKLATAYNQNAYTAEMKQRLELYKKNQPYRQTFTKTPANVSRENRPEK